MSIPKWDLTPFFPSVGSTEFATQFSAYATSIGDAERLWDRESVAGGGEKASASSVESVLGTLNNLLEKERLFGCYLECLVTTNSKDDEAAARMSEYEALGARLGKLQTRFALWVGGQDVDALVAESATLAAHEYALHKLKVRSRHLMETRLESLVSDLRLSGSLAWVKLHSNLTSQIMVAVDGEVMPMTAVRNLACHPDRAKRASAYQAELAAWTENEVAIAACLNGIKGEVNTLGKSRRWDSPLDEAIYNANIDRATLDAMMTAARESYPVFRRYLKTKARGLGIEKLAFHDLFAPVGAGAKEWPYEDGCTFVAENFRKYSDKMGDFAERNFRENWIDAEPRNAKVGGAYCTSLRGDESRILMNYDPSYNSVGTLAHELGHGYHNLCLAGRRPLQADTPATMAETASIFCETIVKEAALATVGEADQLAILEACLQNQCQVVVDISSRFLFEQSVFERRAARELSATEFCQLMLDAQRQTYGDGLDERLLHPYMWAVKPHYYSTYSFYNFPYMFGLLFGLGLYAIYKQDPDGFRARYDDLLSSTGLADAPTLAAKFGIDVRSVDFWRGSLAQIAADVERFERLV